MKPAPSGVPGAPLKGGAKCVKEALAARGFDITIREFPAGTRTAAEAAAAIGCEVAQIAKFPVFRLTPQDLVTVSGGRIADIKQA